LQIQPDKSGTVTGAHTSFIVRCWIGARNSFMSGTWQSFHQRFTPLTREYWFGSDFGRDARYKGR